MKEYSQKEFDQDLNELLDAIIKITGDGAGKPMVVHLIKHFAAIKVLQHNLDSILEDARKMTPETTSNDFYGSVEDSRKAGMLIAEQIIKNTLSITVKHEEEKP